jgi:hypothetical protein
MSENQVSLDNKKRRFEEEQFNNSMKVVKLRASVFGQVDYFESESLDELFVVIRAMMKNGFVVNGGIQQVQCFDKGNVYKTKYTVTLTRDKPK